jgi:hypothetical protein
VAQTLPSMLISESPDGTNLSSTVIISPTQVLPKASATISFKFALAPDTKGDCVYTVLEAHLWDRNVGAHQSLRLILRNYFNLDFAYGSEAMCAYFESIESINGGFKGHSPWVQPGMILRLPEIHLVDCLKAGGIFEPYE